MEYYINALLSWDGRIARLQYFGYNILIVILAALAACIGIGLITVNNTGLSIIATIFLIIVFAFYVYASMTIMAKRLHDIGYGAINIIWIWLLGVASTAIEQSSPTFGMILSLISLGISLYILFAPGQPFPNQYGNIPNPTTNNLPPTYPNSTIDK